MSGLPLTGGCGCGAVRFEVREPFLSASYCHCTRCQRRSGTATSANARTTPEAFAVVQGEQHLRSWAPEGGAEKVFCGLCGGHLFSRTSGGEARIGVRLGAVDGDPGIRPQWHEFVAYAAAWAELPEDGLPRYPEARS